MTIVAAAAVFSTSHIAFTAAVTGALTLVGAVLLLGRRPVPWESVVIAVIAMVAVFLWRKSANMPQLNDDGLQGFSANDWLAPVVTFVMLGLYRSVRPPANERRFGQVQALATVIAFAVNVITI